jgi:hypothetical protein
MSRYIAAIHPRVTQELYDHIASKCEQPDIRPGADMHSLMYAAGQQKVLEWLHDCLATSTVVGNDINRKIT